MISKRESRTLNFTIWLKFGSLLSVFDIFTLPTKTALRDIVVLKNRDMDKNWFFFCLNLKMKVGDIDDLAEV